MNPPGQATDEGSSPGEQDFAAERSRPAVEDSILEKCYGVCAMDYHRSRSADETCTPLILELPDGTTTELSLPIQVPVAALQLSLHLHEGQPPPMATCMRFADMDVPGTSTLAQMGVVEGAVVQLILLEAVRVMLGTRDGDCQVAALVFVI